MLLDVVKVWCGMMKMIVNALTTHILIFPGPKEEDECEFTYWGTPLEGVPSTKYLGI